MHHPTDLAKAIFFALATVVLWYVFIVIAKDLLHRIWCMLRNPRRYFEANERHIALAHAIRAVNRGDATAQDLRLVHDAERMRMVGSLFYIDSAHRLRTQYVKTTYCLQMSARGEYPTYDAIDAELEEFRL